MKTVPKIFVDENEFDFKVQNPSSEGAFKLNAETSVSKLKAHFFELLGQLGEIVKFKRKEARPGSELAKALEAGGALVACFHEPPPSLNCRLLQHTKGGLMLTGGFLNQWTIRKSTLNLVETERQKIQIEGSGASWNLPLSVYAQRLSTDIFHLNLPKTNPTDINDAEFSLMYAGRFIPNKGMPQLIRGLNLWPMHKCSLTMIGAWEPDFWISQAGSQCVHFRSWFLREVLRRNTAVSISMLEPVQQPQLVAHYRNATAFVYPSFHEDEASGNAAHEAVLSGMPAIVTDWCGLGQLGRNTRGGCVATYPTLGGIRYSIKDLCCKIYNTCLNEGHLSRNRVEEDADWVRKTFDPVRMRESLFSGLCYLLEQSATPPLPGGWRHPDRLDLLRTNGPPVFQKALAVDTATDIQGLYAEGRGYENVDYSEPHLYTAIQSLYTTLPTAPVLKPGLRLHGFWRVAPWEQERALVEFGFPGPRLLRFSEDDWQKVVAGAVPTSVGDFAFEVKDTGAVEVFQRAVELGYLVPDDPS